MRFIMLVVHVCKGVACGIKSEVNKLKEQTKRNELIKQKVEELNMEYKRLGEYVYYIQYEIDDERYRLLCSTITHLQEEIRQYEQEIRGE